MTWSEYYNKLVEAGANDADLVVGRLMDLYESWDWDAQVPEGVM